MNPSGTYRMMSEADFDAMVYSEKLKAGWEAIESFYAQVCCVGGSCVCGSSIVIEEPCR